MSGMTPTEPHTSTKPWALHGTATLLISEALLLLQICHMMPSEDATSLLAIAPAAAQTIQDLKGRKLDATLQTVLRNQSKDTALVLSSEPRVATEALARCADAIDSLHWLFSTAKAALRNTHSFPTGGPTSAATHRSVVHELTSLSIALRSKLNVMESCLQDFTRLQRWSEIATMYRAEIVLVIELLQAGGSTNGEPPSERQLATLGRMIVARTRAEHDTYLRTESSTNLSLSAIHLSGQSVFESSVHSTPRGPMKGVPSWHSPPTPGPASATTPSSVSPLRNPLNPLSSIMQVFSQQQ